MLIDALYLILLFIVMNLMHLKCWSRFSFQCIQVICCFIYFPKLPFLMDFFIPIFFNYLKSSKINAQK